MAYLKTIAEATDAIRTLEPFTTGTLTGSCGLDGNYTVSSYGVIIAVDYYTAEGEPKKTWLTPRKYSQTTSRHLNLVKKAWGLN